MTTRNSISVKKRVLSVLIFFLISSFCFAAKENKKWTIAAEKFSYTKGQTTNSVTESTAEMLPSRILEKLGQSLVRSVAPDERYERTFFDLRKERMSLFLQLSNEYKKRDAIVLNNYSERELKKKIAEQEKNIESIQTKIDDNLEALKEAQEETARLEAKKNTAKENEKKSESELFKYSSLVKNLFVKNEEVFTVEDIVFYRNDITTLYSPGEAAKKAGYLSYQYEKECVNASVNTLLAGSITAYGDYVSVCVDLYLYPGAKHLGSVMEVGSIGEFDLLSTNIAQQLLPMITNAMPVQVEITVGTENLKSDVFLYIDDQIQEGFTSTMLMDSGVHSIQFVAEGYKSAATSYFFEGNQNYSIEVELEELQEGTMLIGITRPPVDLFLQSLPFGQKYSDNGKVYYNGIGVTYDDENRSQITINGNKILGQFITEDGETAFFYIPEKLIYDGGVVSINPKAFDRSEYIDKRRKSMYFSYSLLITSLIPSFYCYGKYQNLAMRWNSLYEDLPQEDFYEAQRLQKTTYLCMGISVGCGVLFITEMIRYFTAANSVLPQKAKHADMVEPIIPSVTQNMETENTDIENTNTETTNTETTNTQTSEVAE